MKKNAQNMSCFNLAGCWIVFLLYESMYTTEKPIQLPTTPTAE